MKFFKQQKPFAFFSLLVSMTLTGLLHGQVPISFDLRDLQNGATSDQISEKGLVLQASSNDCWYETSRGEETGLVVFNTGLSVLWQNNPTMTLSFHDVEEDIRIDGFTAGVTSYESKEYAETGNKITLSKGADMVAVDLNDIVHNDRIYLAYPITISAGETLTLQAFTPSGATMNIVRFSELHVTLVPEPSTYTLLLGVLALVVKASATVKARHAFSGTGIKPKRRTGRV